MLTVQTLLCSRPGSMVRQVVISMSGSFLLLPAAKSVVSRPPPRLTFWVKAIDFLRRSARFFRESASSPLISPTSARIASSPKVAPRPRPGPPSWLRRVVAGSRDLAGSQLSG